MRIIKKIRMHYHDFMSIRLAKYNDLESREYFLYHINQYIKLRDELKL